MFSFKKHSQTAPLFYKSRPPWSAIVSLLPAGCLMISPHFLYPLFPYHRPGHYFSSVYNNSNHFAIFQWKIFEKLTISAFFSLFSLPFTPYFPLVTLLVYRLLLSRSKKCVFWNLTGFSYHNDKNFTRHHYFLASELLWLDYHSLICRWLI